MMVFLGGFWKIEVSRMANNEQRGKVKTTHAIICDFV